jgi:hypothetical protein
MTPWTVSAGDVDKAGRAVLDLEASGRAKEIHKKLDQLFQQGKPRPTTVRSVVIATAGSGNRVPAKQLASVQDFELGPTPHVDLKGVISLVTARNFKAGKKEFVVELTALGVGPTIDLELSTSPGRTIRVAGGPAGNGKVQLKAQSGRSYRVQVSVPLTFKLEKRTVKVPRTYKIFVPGGWRTKRGRREYDNRVDTKEVWTGGDVTLKAQGTGGLDHLVKTVKLRAESWAAGWLNGPPPPPFRHNIC